jgi:hypothetical protein
VNAAHREALEAIVASDDPSVRPGDRVKAIELLSEAAEGQDGTCERCAHVRSLSGEQLDQELAVHLEAETRERIEAEVERRVEESARRMESELDHRVHERARELATAMLAERTSQPTKSAETTDKSGKESDAPENAAEEPPMRPKSPPEIDLDAGWPSRRRRDGFRSLLDP